MSIFNLSLSPFKAEILCDEMAFDSNYTAKHAVTKVACLPAKGIVVFGQGSHLVGWRIVQHIEIHEATSFDDLAEVTKAALDESLDYWDLDDGELYVIAGYDAARKRVRAAEVSAIEFDILAQTAARIPAKVRELTDGIHLYPALIGATLPPKGGAELLKKAALIQHNTYSTPERTASGGRLWLYTVKREAMAAEKVGALPDIGAN